MSSDPNVPRASKKLVWAGRILSALPIPLLVMSAVMKLSQSPDVVKGFGDFGYDPSILVPLGIVELLCVILYVIPQTAVLGAILLTGYLGGATATHVRVGDAFIAPVIMGVILWLGLYLRDSRLRALVPWRT
jgi:hypothetical protein